MFISKFFVLLFEFFLLFIGTIMVLPIRKYKILKTKEDQLFIGKTFLTLIFFFIDCIYSTFSLLNIITSNDNIISIIIIFLFNTYIIAIIFYNFFLCLELYFTYSNPLHFFNRLFKLNKCNYIPELLILIVSILTIICDVFFYTKFKDIYDNYLRLIMPNFYKFGVIILFSMISIIICLINKNRIKKFCFKRQEKLINILNKRVITNLLYIIYGALYAIPLLLDIETQKTFNEIGAFISLLIIIIDLIIHISLLSRTKFCEYRLKRTMIGFICSIFYKPKKEIEDPVIPLMSDSIINETTSGLVGTTLQGNEASTVSELISNSSIDKELILAYKNGIFLEDYFLFFFDQILNILFISIFQVYYSKMFSTKANDTRLSKDININEEEVSGIGGGYNTNMSTTTTVLGEQLSNTNSTVGDYTASFKLKKNMENDDYGRFKAILENGQKIENNNNYLNISIQSFFTPRCVETIYEHRLKGKLIGNSLLSHMILSGNKTKNSTLDIPNINYWSLTIANIKEEYFRKLKNTRFKTYDKTFNIDIFDSNEEELIIKDKGKNNEISILLDKYFTYIHAKGVNGTFIPSLVGVFKVKINTFKTLLVFITRNSLVENVPKNFFTYWQLLRFLDEKPQKLASSQFNSGSGNRGNLVKDDPIFERLFQVEGKNQDYNKINLINFNDFKDTIKSDISFLNKCGSQNFDLLLMYYEYENTQKHEKGGIIKIKKIDDNKAEIIQESLPDGIQGELATPMNSNNFRFPGESLKNNTFSLGGGLLEGVDDDMAMGNIDINAMKQNCANLMDYSEKISINGYEGIFDSFNCMCFFTFDNIFDVRKKNINTNFYSAFQNKILEHFTSFKK